MSRGATKEGTTQYAEKFRGVAGEGHFREAQDLVVSSLGVGTYLGQPNDDKDAGYTAAIVAAVQAGINVIDTAINYRFQRSERNVGAALKVLQQPISGQLTTLASASSAPLKLRQVPRCDGCISPASRRRIGIRHKPEVNH